MSSPFEVGQACVDDGDGGGVVDPEDREVDVDEAKVPQVLEPERRAVPRGRDGCSWAQAGRPVRADDGSAGTV